MDDMARDAMLDAHDKAWEEGAANPHEMIEIEGKKLTAIQAAVLEGLKTYIRNGGDKWFHENTLSYGVPGSRVMHPNADWALPNARIAMAVRQLHKKGWLRSRYAMREGMFYAFAVSKETRLKELAEIRFNAVHNFQVAAQKLITELDLDERSSIARILPKNNSIIATVDAEMAKMRDVSDDIAF